MLDVRAAGFWGERELFDVRVFNPYAPKNRTIQMRKVYASHEEEKNLQYHQRFIEVERASFPLLIFSASGGMSQTTTIVYSRFAGMIAEKLDQPYHELDKNATIVLFITFCSHVLAREPHKKNYSKSTHRPNHG